MRDYDYEMRLKIQIESYWRERGHTPRVFIDTKKDDREGNIYCIRSDMLGGKPIGARNDAIRTQNRINRQYRLSGRKIEVVRGTYRTT